MAHGPQIWRLKGLGLIEERAGPGPGSIELTRNGPGVSPIEQILVDWAGLGPGQKAEWHTLDIGIGIRRYRDQTRYGTGPDSVLGMRCYHIY